MSGKCKECGCICARCTKNETNRHSEVHLHAEIEHLRQSLIEKDSHIVTMETQFLSEAEKFPNGELAAMREEMTTWQEKYSRLCEAHKRVQKVNQNLEDKLLKIVDKCETEKGAFTKDIATLSHRLADANYTIHRLSQDNAKYRNDVNLAIQLLQCKPSNFVGQKYDSLPTEVQAKVKNYIAEKRRTSDESPPEIKSITVPISTFPPTAMVYNISKVDKHSDDESVDDSKPPVDVVSAAIMAKVLEDRERERIFSKHCETCVCHKTIVTVDSETQTSQGEIVPVNADEMRRTVTKLSAVKTQIKMECPVKAGIKTKTKPNKRPDSVEKMDVKVNPRCTDKIIQSRTANPVDIINERIWKNNWVKSTRIEENANSPRAEIPGDVINERVWKKEPNLNTQVTLIEVTNAVNANVTPEMAASPSFSSDSVVISSSEPSSSSSDLMLQSLNDKRRTFNAAPSKERVVGPRNCLVHVSREGSKNILLDNAGQFQTVLYTSPDSGSGSTNQTNTALVHNLGKSSHSSRSLSISSDEAFPILLSDATQLQRVAEWVQSSVGAGKAVVPGRAPAIPPPPSLAAVKALTADISCNVPEVPNSIKCPMVLPERPNLDRTDVETKDLISFDSNNEDEDDESVKLLEKSRPKAVYDVKITKEMEETYLKLAASLDPVSLRLSTCASSDLTIEKYRKDHKRVHMQKIHDNTGTTT